MAITIPALPPEGSTNWYPNYAALDGAVRELQAQVAALTVPTGLVFSVNGVTPSAGDVVLGASDVNAMAAGYAPGYTDLPGGQPTYVDKDPVTGFWPTSYASDGTPVYTGGSTNHGVRPHARPSPVIWRGAEPSPDAVSSGTGGMLRGFDERAIPGP